MNPKTMKAALADIEKTMPDVKWSRTEGPSAGTFFQGEANDWHFTVVSFDIEDQGFPPGTRGYDGAVRSKGLVMRLTRELAEKAFKLAEKQHEHAADRPV